MPPVIDVKLPEEDAVWAKHAIKTLEPHEFLKHMGMDKYESPESQTYHWVPLRFEKYNNPGIQGATYIDTKKGKANDVGLNWGMRGRHRRIWKTTVHEASHVYTTELAKIAQDELRRIAITEKMTPWEMRKYVFRTTAAAESVPEYGVPMFFWKKGLQECYEAMTEDRGKKPAVYDAAVELGELTDKYYRDGYKGFMEDVVRERSFVKPFRWLRQAIRAAEKYRN